MSRKQNLDNMGRPITSDQTTLNYSRLCMSCRSSLEKCCLAYLRSIWLHLHRVQRRRRKRRRKCSSWLVKETRRVDPTAR